MKKVVLYMRYSSLSQSEQSIEGQNADLTAFCKTRNYKIINRYIDRATSASKDIKKRKQFLKMIEDSAKGEFDAVVIWSFDRFARNRQDSSLYRAKLKANGVDLISIKEDVPDAPIGIIMEGLFDAMAEYYSAELSVKVKRGIRQSALKHKALGGIPLLGYKTDKDKNIVIDPDKVEIVRDIFTMFANGVNIIDISRYLSELGIYTHYGNKYSITAIKRILTNERYIGVYKHQDIRVENAVPAIIDKKTFDKCQFRLIDSHINAYETDYLVTGKCYCYCGGAMKAYAGKSHTKALYRYYCCENHRKKKTDENYCACKPIRKEVLEKAILDNTNIFLSLIDVRKMAKMIYDDVIQLITDNTLSTLEKDIKEIQKVINHLLDAISVSGPSTSLLNRLEENEALLKELQIEYDGATAYLPKEEEIYSYIQELSEVGLADEDEKYSLCKTIIERIDITKSDNEIGLNISYYAVPKHIQLATLFSKKENEAPSRPENTGSEDRFVSNKTGAVCFLKNEPFDANITYFYEKYKFLLIIKKFMCILFVCNLCLMCT